MYIYTPIGARVSVAVSSTVSYTIPANASGALIQALTQNVRISLDSASPATASDGIQIKAGDPARLLNIGAGKTFTAQQETATATFYVQYIKLERIHD